MRHLYLFFLLITTVCFSQTKDKIISGTVFVGNLPAEGIEVFSISSARTVKTDANGKFTIQAKPNDAFVLSGFNVEMKRRTLTSAEYKSGTVKIALDPKVTEIDEVVVDITPTTYGTGSNVKEYTPAERKLRTGATPVRLDQGIMVSNDAIANAISGRTKEMKKELAVEHREKAIERLEQIFSDEYLIENFRIRKQYVQGFRFYAVENDEVRAMLESPPSLELEIALSKLAAVYKESHADGKN